MSGEKGLALPEGTKVRMTCDYESFTKGDIVTRKQGGKDNENSVRFDSDNDFEYLPDSHWELIEEPKEDWLIQDTNGNLTKSDRFRTPKQGDRVHVKGEYWPDFSDDVCTFVCFYKNQVLVEKNNRFAPYSEWRFPPQEEVTLSDGKTYLVEERGGEKILKLKN